MEDNGRSGSSSLLLLGRTSSCEGQSPKTTTDNTESVIISVAAAYASIWEAPGGRSRATQRGV